MPAVPTSAPRRSVTRARAAGASRPVTVMRTRLRRPSGCWYKGVGVAPIVTGGAGSGERDLPTIGRLPSHAAKPQLAIAVAMLAAINAYRLSLPPHGKGV